RGVRNFRVQGRKILTDPGTATGKLTAPRSPHSRGCHRPRARTAPGDPPGGSAVPSHGA
ncbi:MAG: hypothetical protein BJ554DRAFT_8160, partial [Olpidium bornovanus]